MSKSPLEPISPPGSAVPARNRAELRKIIHDLNGELFLMRGYADRALEEAGDNEKAVHNLNKLLRRSQSVEGLLKKLRRFASD